MKSYVSTSVFMQTLALVLLLVFQILFVLASTLLSHWAVLAASFLVDGVLVLMFVKSARLKKATEQRRFQQIDQVMKSLLELTETQQDHWRSALEALGRREIEVQAGGPAVAELVTALNSQAGRPVQIQEGELTFESIVDSIQTLVLLNHTLTADLDSALEFYRQTSLRLKKVQVEYHLNHLRLGESVEFLTRMGSKTNQYSEKLVLEVLDSFKEITQFSAGISVEVVQRMQFVMDPENPQSLDAVRQGSAEVEKTMDHFFAELGKAGTDTENAVRQNLVQMEKVQEMAKAIADFSESIRMISLNLNIEAARVTHQGGGAAGRGFQVLATKLSEFAVRARQLAQQQQDAIGTASQTLIRSGEQQRRQFSSLMSQVSPIKARLQPFSEIVAATFSQFERVKGTMETLSSSIHGKLESVIGKFQYQDLVRQEQEHILALICHVRDLADRVDDRGGALDPMLKAQALDQLLKTFEAMSSTENERAVLREFRNNSSLASTKVDLEEVTAGSVSLF